jgi:hypothetical protein
MGEKGCRVLVALTPRVGEGGSKPHIKKNKQALEKKFHNL